ncbi:MAG: hypothetical protein AAGE65_15025 [Planctomycetota bacterium]
MYRASKRFAIPHKPFNGKLVAYASGPKEEAFLEALTREQPINLKYKFWLRHYENILLLKPPAFKHYFPCIARSLAEGLLPLDPHGPDLLNEGFFYYTESHTYFFRDCNTDDPKSLSQKQYLPKLLAELNQEELEFLLTWHRLYLSLYDL